MFYTSFARVTQQSANGQYIGLDDGVHVHVVDDAESGFGVTEWRDASMMGMMPVGS